MEIDELHNKLLLVNTIFDVNRVLSRNYFNFRRGGQGYRRDYWERRICSGPSCSHTLQSVNIAVCSLEITAVAN